MKNKIRWICHALVVSFLLGIALPTAKAWEQLWVVSFWDNTVKSYDGITGAFLGTVASGGGMSQPSHIAYGLENRLYVASHASDEIKRYDWTTGAFVDNFVSAGGALDGPNGLAFGPGGTNLYVSSFNSGEVQKYDSAGALVASLPAYQAGPQTLGPDNNLYVSRNSGIERFTTSPFADIGNFAAGIGDPTFGPDGNLYVLGGSPVRVARYNGTSGAYIDDFVNTTQAFAGGLQSFGGLAFGPDGNLYASDWSNDRVARFNGTTGAPMGDFVTPGSGGLDGAFGILFVPEPTVVTLVGLGGLLMLRRRR